MSVASADGSKAGLFGGPLMDLASCEKSVAIILLGTERLRSSLLQLQKIIIERGSCPTVFF
jgi:uncharacterized protein YllA (UPF0747 family)